MNGRVWVVDSPGLLLEIKELVMDSILLVVDSRVLVLGSRVLVLERRILVGTAVCLWWTSEVWW